VALGLAAVLKAFPLLLLVPVLQLRKLRAFWAAIATIGVLNLAGLALPSVSIGGAIGALSSATSVWFDLPSNISLARNLHLAFGLGGSWLIWPVAVVGLAVMIRGLTTWRPLPDVAWLWTASIGVLISPLAWEAYLLFHLPLALAVAIRLDARSRWLLVAPLALVVVPFYGPIILGTASAAAMAIFSAAADAVMVVARPTADQLQPAANRMAVLSKNQPVGWVLIGEKPYSPADVAEAFGFPVVSVLPHDARAADNIVAGADPTKLRRSALLHRLHGGPHALEHALGVRHVAGQVRRDHPGVHRIRGLL